MSNVSDISGEGALGASRGLLVDERGSVATIFAILLPVLLGFTALAVEAGFWFSERQRLQIASDAAAFSALTAYAEGANLNDASARGVTEAQASGFDGPASAIAVAVTPASGSRGAYATATISDTLPLFLTRLFLPTDVLPVGVQSFAALSVTPGKSTCLLALDGSSSRALLLAASVNVTLQDCVASANSTPNDSIWLEGTARLTADCISTPGNLSWNGGAVVTLHECSYATFPREAQTDPYAGTPFWGHSSIPSPAYFADASISQGRYGPGMPGGATLAPGKYGKQVEIAGEVTLQPGIYYFTNGFRATNGAKIKGTGVTLFFDQTKLLDVPQQVGWRLTAPTSGPTQGIALMGDPTKTAAGDVRLIGTMGNVQGAIYFPHQRVLTESGPNTTPALCTTVVAKRIDIRGDGPITMDCSGGTGGSSSGTGKVRLVEAPPA